MDVEQSNRAPIAFRESCLAALYTVLLLASPMAAYCGLCFVVWLGVEIYYRWQTGVACCVAAGAILGLVRWLNHRETPRRFESVAKNSETAKHAPPAVVGSREWQDDLEQKRLAFEEQASAVFEKIKNLLLSQEGRVEGADPKYRIRAIVRVSDYRTSVGHDWDLPGKPLLGSFWFEHELQVVIDDLPGNLFSKDEVVTVTLEYKNGRWDGSTMDVNKKVKFEKMADLPEFQAVKIPDFPEFQFH